jgi:hypothetical protein
MTNVRFPKEKVEKNEIGDPMTHQYIDQHRDKAYYNDRESGGSVVHTYFTLVLVISVPCVIRFASDR